MEAFLLALLIGVVAGLRAMLVPAVVGWAAYLGIIDLDGTWLAFFERPWMPWLLSLLAVSELVTDQLPSTPSRTVPVQFVTRIRARLASAFGRDRPAAFIEDAVALVASIAIVAVLP